MPGAADVDSLVALGRAEPPPRPSPPAPPAHQTDPPKPAPSADPANEAALNAALAAAGVSVEAEDAAAVTMLAGLDSATVAVVAGWLRRKGGPPNTPTK
jgi:hypothetical protein